MRHARIAVYKNKAGAKPSLPSIFNIVSAQQSVAVRFLGLCSKSIRGVLCRNGVMKARRNQRDTPSDCVKRCLRSAQLWQSLTSHRSVKKLVAKSIVAQARHEGENGPLAQLLVAISAKAKKRKASSTRRGSISGRNTELQLADSAWPPRVRKRLHFKQNSNCLWMTKGIGLLNINLMATILGSVDLSTKLSAISVSRGLREVLQCSTAWDRLVVNPEMCQRILRHANRPGFFRPQVFEKVSAIDVHLMDAENWDQSESETEDDQDRAEVFGNPFLTFGLALCRRLFPNISEATIWNINSEDFRIFLVVVRCRCLKSFSFVRTQYMGNGIYCLKAKQHEPPLVDCTEVLKINSSRIPPLVQDESTTISDSEALFLLEHPTTFKNGRSIFFMDAPDEIVSSHEVRKDYKGLLDCLKERFPNRFR